MARNQNLSTKVDSVKNYFKGVSLDDPPKTFEQGKRDWRTRHDEVLSYARLLFTNLASEDTLWQAKKNAMTYNAFYTGAESPQPTEFQLSMISANIINAAINIKESTLLNHRLEMHYIADKNQDYDLAVAVQRLFDWQGLRTHRDWFKAQVEKDAIIQGTSGLLLLPKEVDNRGRKIIIPAYPEKIELAKCYFDVTEDNEDDYTCFIIRDVIRGHLADQQYRKLLDERGLETFQRGTAFSIWDPYNEDNLSYWNPIPTRSLYGGENADYLATMGGDDVEMIRIWKRDYRTVKAKLYKPYIDPATKQIDPESDSEQTQYARWVASKELMQIIHTGHMPQAGENHYNHLLVHNVDLESMEADIKLPDTETTSEQIEFMKNHIAMTEEFLDSGDQVEDKKIEVPMYDGNWRYIKIIGDQIITDGSIKLEYNKFPVVLFRNAIDPNTSLGLAEVAQLANLNAALNSLIADLIMNSHDNAFPDKRLPERFKNAEANPQGETLFVNTDEDQDWMFQPVSPGQYPSHAFNAIGLLQGMIELVSGASSTARGDPGQVRSSGVETQTRLIAAQQRFMSSEVLFSHAWDRFAEITLGQLCQGMRGQALNAIIGPEYQDVAPILIDAIDPYATIKTVRVPKDTDFENQNGQQTLQMAMLMLQAQMVTPKTVMKVLAQQGNGGNVSRIFGQFWAEMQRPEVQQEMAEMQKMAEAAQMRKGSK